MAAQEDNVPIPQPPTKFLLGNIPDIDPLNGPASMWRLADIYGEIFKLDLPGRTTIVVSSYDLVNEICDPTRFEKPINGALTHVRMLLKDGLFTAYNDEPNWGIAHRLLMPIFGPIGIRKMFGGMMDIASQMLLRWDRFGPDHDILCSDDFTRLAFDMIGFCAFGFRFNNFYTDNPHPFVTQMTEVLTECGKRASRLEIENKLRIFSAAQTQENIAAMVQLPVRRLLLTWHHLCDEIIAERIAHPQPDSVDLLNPMLEGKDSKTGQKMSMENVRYNMCTFLVAGHETTSGTLGFLFYHMLKNPETYIKAQQEVDRVLGTGPMEAKHLSELPYIKYSIFEALRFMGPISLTSKRAIEDTVIGGKYHIKKTDVIMFNLKPFHHDPKVWGDDADVFRPERWLNGGFEKLPKNAFKPFGDGERACIGRGFAEQEMIIIVALILQKFQVEAADPSYVLTLQVSLTLKPGDFKIKVRRRPGRDMASLGGAIGKPIMAAVHQDSKKESNGVLSQKQEQPITILYGSQAGTCKTYAEELESNASRYGFKASVRTLDSATESIPKDEPIVIVSPSYEGQPADNAKKFVKWLEANQSSANMLEGVKYAVFGVGNSDWGTTFHRIPKLLDDLFEKMGAKRFTKTGFVDVKYDIIDPWEAWVQNMWEDVRKASGTIIEVTDDDFKAEISAPKFVTHLGGADIGYGVVKINKDLGGSEVGLAKKHMEIELPVGTGYRAGDYVVILPLNNITTVRRVIKRFNITPDDDITVSGTNKVFLSPSTPISVFDLLMSRVELGTPISQKQLQVLAETTPENNRSKLLELLKEDVYKNEVLPKRYTLLDLLEDNPDTKLPFATYLNMLKPLTPRQYSVSSSPLANVDFVETPKGVTGQKLTASVTYDVHKEKAWSGHGEFLGVASTYLSRQESGDRVRCFMRPTNVNFHLPLNPLTPIIMVCAGTGLAPMRGFIQERATIKAARKGDLGPALLYFGCRHHEKDYIYADELKQWEKEGVVSLRTCFSKMGLEGASKYVPDRMWEEREELAALFREGAKVFVCGSAKKLAKSAAEACKKIYKEKTGKSDTEAQEWLDKVKEDRYVSDVFE